MYTVKVEKEMTIENAINTFKCQLTYSMKSVKRCTYKEKPLKHQNMFITLADIALDGNAFSFSSPKSLCRGKTTV